MLIEDSTIPCLLRFQTSVANIDLPKEFTFPFYYTPSEIAQIAAKELQNYLETQTDWQHRFSIHQSIDGLVIGKMFGVLVVKDKQGKLGYLVAFSGKLAEKNEHPFFVPPVFDLLKQDGFFRKGEEIINQINARIESIEQSDYYITTKNNLIELKAEASKEIQVQRKRIKVNKKERDLFRSQQTHLTQDVIDSLAKQSLTDKFILKDLTRSWEEKINLAQANLQQIEDEILSLKEERKERSSRLQNQIFEQYTFLNQAKVEKSLLAIFQPTIFERPPAGAGECAAPKLLQYAFLNELQPIALAEFWWGDSPKSEIRKHEHFYPACRGKCEPILGHMLTGMIVEPNPMLTNPAENKSLPIIYEDEYILAVNKPAEFLSVPGKNIEDSVYTRIKALYPQATGPLIVHRLDMSTSGILLLAKSLEVYKKLQFQFIKRFVKKRYVALLDGKLNESKGTIELPLRLDIDDRPRQLVCYEFGKHAKTHFEVIETKNNQTKVYFYPVTGRTHQLRVHASHPNGLNAPILGDDLYGKPANRLHLHAEWIEFTHPITKEIIQLQVDADF